MTFGPVANFIQPSGSCEALDGQLLSRDGRDLRQNAQDGFVNSSKYSFPFWYKTQFGIWPSGAQRKPIRLSSAV